MKHFVFELKLYWSGIYGDLLCFVPVVILLLSTAPSVKIRWFGAELELWIGFLSPKFKIIYLTPLLSLKFLNKRFKEIADFNFCWGAYAYRKLFGERKTYKTTIQQEMDKFYNEYCKK